MTTTCEKAQNAPAHLGHCGVLLSSHQHSQPPDTYNILRPVFAQLWCIYDQFAAQPRHGMPWWYTERTIVGHLTAAAFRAGYIALEEFSCSRGKDARPGRTDWWVATPDATHEIMAECKHLYISSSRSGWGALRSYLDGAEDQLKGYKSEPTCKESHKVVMCCVTPYYMHSDDPNEERDNWLHEVPEGADYCAYYWLEQQYLHACKYDKHTYPGILICCREIPVS